MAVIIVIVNIDKYSLRFNRWNKMNVYWNKDIFFVEFNWLWVKLVCWKILFVDDQLYSKICSAWHDKQWLLIFDEQPRKSGNVYEYFYVYSSYSFENKILTRVELIPWLPIEYVFSSYF